MFFVRQYFFSKLNLCLEKIYFFCNPRYFKGGGLDPFIKLQNTSSLSTPVILGNLAWCSAIETNKTSIIFFSGSSVHCSLCLNRIRGENMIRFKFPLRNVKIYVWCSVSSLFYFIQWTRMFCLPLSAVVYYYVYVYCTLLPCEETFREALWRILVH
jgi:hypothetical protein